MPRQETGGSRLPLITSKVSEETLPAGRKTRRIGKGEERISNISTIESEGNKIRDEVPFPENEKECNGEKNTSCGTGFKRPQPVAKRDTRGWRND